MQSLKSFVIALFSDVEMETWRCQANPDVWASSLRRCQKWDLSPARPQSIHCTCVPPQDLSPAKGSSRYLSIHPDLSSLPLRENPMGTSLKVPMGRCRGNSGPQLPLLLLDSHQDPQNLNDPGRDEVIRISTPAHAQPV